MGKASVASPESLFIRKKAALTVSGKGALPMTRAVHGQVVIVTGDEGRALYKFSSGDLTEKVAADTQGGYFIPVSGDPTGASGGWEFQTVTAGVFFASDFGVKPGDPGNQTGKLQAAIDVCELMGGGEVRLQAGVVRASGLILKPGVGIRGAGREETTIKAPDNWDDASVIETQGFDSDYAAGGNGVVHNPSIKEMTIDGNFEAFGGVASLSNGAGVRVYGLRPEIENVRVQACPGIGIHTALYAQTRNSTLWFREDTKLGYIRGLRVFGCAYDGWVFEGPSDIWIDDVEAGVNGWKDPGVNIDSIPYDASYKSLFQPGEPVSNIWFRTTADVGFVHSFGCRQGRGLTLGNGSSQARFKASLIVVESCDEGVLVDDLTRMQISIADVHNCYGKSGEPYWKDISSFQTQVDSLEIVNSANASGQTLVHLGGSKADYRVKIEGNGHPAHGVEVAGNNIVVSGDVRNVAGSTSGAEASTGLMVRASAAQWSAKVRVNASDVVSKVEAGAVGAFDTCIIDNFGNAVGFVGYDDLSSNERIGLTLIEEGAPRKSNRMTGVSGTLTASSTETETVDIPINALWKPNMEEVSVQVIYVSGAAPVFEMGPVIYEATSAAGFVRVGYRLAEIGTAVFKIGVKVQ